MIFVLAVLVPVLFVVSLMARQAPPDPNSEIPHSFDSVSSNYTTPGGVSGTFAAQPAIAYRTMESQASNRTAIELSTTERLRLPELLVYWSAEDVSTSLPEDRVLLGSWAVTSARIFELPERASGSSGTVTLYSLSQQNVVASATPLN